MITLEIYNNNDLQFNKHGFHIVQPYYMIYWLYNDYVKFKFSCLLNWIHYLTEKWRSIMLHTYWSMVLTSKQCVLTTYSKFETQNCIYCQSIRLPISKYRNCHRKWLFSYYSGHFCQIILKFNLEWWNMDLPRNEVWARTDWQWVSDCQWAGFLYSHLIYRV